MRITVTVAVVLILGDTASPPDKLGPVYNDTCEKYAGRCGDQCIHRDADCHCGGPYILQPGHLGIEEHYCCISSRESCTLGVYWSGGICSQGRKLPMSSKCDNPDRSLQCYNSYQDSQFISKHSHYTCPLTCVSVNDDMCRGVNWCGSDVQECGPQLRCSEYDDKTRTFLCPRTGNVSHLLK